MVKTLKYCFVFLFWLITVKGFAQTYPVQAVVQLTPPYSGYLPDYADPINEQLKLILTLNDFSVPTYSVRLKVKIQGDAFTMQTKAFLTLPPIELTPGVPVQLTGADLGLYLSTANLDITGISAAEYETKKVLPEGMYSVCFEVYDFYSTTNVQVANNACAYAWFSLQEPPLLNLPMCGTEIAPLTPQNLTFSWSPLSMSTTTLLFNTEYQLDIYEVRPAGNNPNIVVSTTIPVFTTTTNQTFYNLGMVDIPLQLGMQYVWRVRAYDITGRAYFKNNGYSQVCTFTYGNIGEAVAGGITLNLTANGLGPRLAQANWNASSSFTNYTFEMRKKGEGNEWFPYTSTDGSLKLTSLEPQTEYECRVKGFAGTYESEYSNTATFITAALPTYACNSTMLPPTETGAAPLSNLKLGDIITTGQFEVVVTQVLPSMPGLFSGLGKVRVDFALLNFNVSFNNIALDENLNLKAGRIDVITRPIEQWENDMLGHSTTPDYEFSGDIDSIHVEGNTITIFSDGETITIDYPGGNYVIEDENGDQWHIYADGTISYVPFTPHVELTNEEKNIYLMALQQLKLFYNDERYAAIKNKYIEERNKINSLNQSRSGWTIDDTVSIQEIRIRSNTDKKINENQIYRDEMTDVYFKSRLEYSLANTCLRLVKPELSTEEYDLYANYIIINSKKSYLYLREEMEKGTSEEVIAIHLRNAIIKFVFKCLMEKR